MYYSLYKHPSDSTQDVLFFRWRVEQIANNYATGPSAGNYSSTDPWSSALWTVLFDIDGSGYRTLAAHLNGSSGAPSTPIDMLAGIWGNIPTQSIDYLNDPNIKLIAHNPTAFTSGSQILNYHNSLSPDTTWPAGSNAAGTTYDYGTTRSRVVSSSPCNEYFVDYQIPIRMLDASSTGPASPALNGPKITRSTPISMLFCTANSLNNPFQKDCALNRGWIADASKPAPFGDYISFDQTAPYAQPIVSSVTATPPNTCPGSYALQAKVQDTLYVDSSGNVKPSIKQVQFFYWLDKDGDGTTTGDAGSAWTLAATATLKAGTMNTWTASWDATGLPKGKYLIGVQAVDDKTLHDDGVPDSPTDNRTFSYMVGSVNTATQGQIYINPWTFDGTSKTWTSGGAGSWVDTQQTSFQTHAVTMTPGASENWYGNPAVTGVQTALIGLAVNACGVSPTITKVVSPSSVATSQSVTYTVTVANATGGTVKLTRLDDPLPTGFTYASTSSVTNNGVSVTPTTYPSNGASGTVSWIFNGGTGIDVANNTSAVLAFVTTASGTAGTYNNTATASTSLGAVTSAAVAVGVDAARVSLSKTPSAYTVNPGGSITYTLAYSNDSSVPVTSATLTDTLPTNVSCTSYSVNGGGSVACSGTSVSISLGTLAAGATGNVALTVAVAAGYSAPSLVNTASLDVIAPDGTTHVTRNASSTIAVNVPAPAFTLTKTASAVEVAPGTTVTWTINYKNYGTAAASGVTITDTLPGGYTYVSNTGGGSNSNGQVTWNIGSVAAGASGSVTVTGTLGTSGQVFSYSNPANNLATVKWSLDSTGVSAKSGIGVTGQACSAVYYFKPDLTASLTAPVAATSGGSTKLTTGTATDSVVFRTDPVGAGSAVVLNGKQLSVSLYIDPSTGGLNLTAQVDRIATDGITVTNITSYTQTNLPNTPGWYSFNFSFAGGTVDLSAGQKLRITFKADNGAGPVKDLWLIYGGTVTYTPGSQSKTVFADSRASICSASSPASLALSKTVDKPSIASATGTLTYILNYANLGGTSASGVSLVDTLPTNLTCSQYTSTCTDWNNVPGTCSAWTSCSGSSLTLSPGGGTLSNGASGKYAVQATVGASASGTLTNNATLSGTGLTSATASANTIVGIVGGSGSPALVLSKSANKTLLVAGDTVTYTLTVVNTGAGSASSVVVTDDFPDQSWFTYGSCSTASGTCSQSPAGTLSWNVGTLAGGASATLTFTMSVAASGIPVGANTLNNSATVSDSSYCTSQAVAGCASNTVTVTVSGNPNLSMTKTSLPASVKPGDVVTYTMVVTNNGSGAATGVVVSDPVPANTIFKAITTAGPGSASFDAVGNRAVFNIGTLASGASATVAFSATVNSIASGSTTITNTASTTATNSPQRSASANSTASAAPVMTLQKNGPSSVAFPATTLSAAASASTSLFVASSALLSVGDWVQVVNGGTNPIVNITAIAGNVLTVNTAVTASSGSAVRRGAVWAITYQNTGNADASNVTVSDPLPANWVYVTSSPTATSVPAVGANGTVSWTVGTVAAGASGTLQVLAIPTASGSVTNTATLAATGLSNVQASLTTAAGGLTISKSTSTATVAAGGVASYTITVRNSLGTAVPASGTGITVTDLLPSGFTYKTGSASLTYTGGGTNGSVEPTGDTTQPQWTNLTIGANGSLTISFQANVAGNVGPATYQNSAELSNVPAGVGVTPFDPLSTTAEDVTVLATNTGVVQGYVYKDLNGNGTYDAGTDLPLTGVRVTITDSGNTSYTVSTDSAGFFSRVVAAGTASVNVVDADIPGGLALATGNTDPANVTVPNGGSVSKDTGYATPAPAWQITKSHSGSFVSGSTGTYTLAVKNIGSASTTGGSTVTVTDTAPTGMTVTAMSGTNWTCTTLPNCTRSDALAAGASYENITVTVSVSTASASLTNAASVSGGGVATSANTTDPTTILQPPAFGLAKSGPANVVAGNAMTYTMTLTNIGASTSGTTATIKDTLPAGVTVTGATAGTGVTSVNCPSFTSPFTCTVTLSAGLAVNGTATFTLSATAPASAGSITNYASVDPTGGASPQNPLGPCTPTSACSSASTTVVGAPAFSLTKTGPTTVVVGGAMTYTMTLTNIGGSASGTTATIKDTLPAGVTVTGATAGTGVTSVNCPNFTSPFTCTVTLSAGLAVNGTATFTLSATAPASAGSITNNASVDPTGGASPQNPLGPCTPTSACSSASTTVVGAPAFSLAKSGPASVVVGGAMTYTMTLTNIGGSTSGTTATIKDTLPAGVTVTGATAGTGVTSVNCPNFTSPFTCTVTLSAGLAVNGTATFTLSATAPGSTGNITNYASVDPSGAASPQDPTLACTPTSACSSATTNVTAAPTPAWQITKSHSGSFVSGSTGTYTLVVKNNGSAATTAGSTVTVTDTAPTGMTVTAMSGTNWTCTTLPNCTRSDALAAGASYENITVTVSVSTASASLTNAASVSGGGVATSANTTDPTTILQPPAFGLAKSGPANVVAGNAMTYTMTLTNIGASTSGTTATIKDTLPAGVTVTSATAGSGVSTVNCPNFTSPFTCTVTLSAGLAVNGTATFTLSATAPASAGNITNNASVDPTGGTSPQNPLGPCTPTTACGSATTSVSAAPTPAWQITKSHSGSFVSGSTGTYTLTVKNVGGAATTGGSTVTVTDTAPTGMTVTAMSGTNWTCTTLPNCTRSDALAAGASYEAITVTVSVSTASASLTNAASVSGGGVASSANTTDPTTIVQPPAFSLSKTGPASVVAGNAMTYTMTLTNIGGSTSGTTATIKDTLPAGVTVTSATAGSGVTSVSCPSFTSPFTCTVTLSAGLVVNGTATFTLSATAPASAGSITNYASVDPTGGTSPQNPLGPCTPTTACGSATTSVSAAPTPAWQITKSHSGSFVSGSTGTYTLTVKNVGGAATTGGSTVTVTDTAPTGMTVTAMSGTNWTCATLPSCTRSDALAAGATYETISVTVSVASNTGGTSLTNTASVSGGGVASTANATDPTTINAPATAPDMAVSLAGLPGKAQVGIAYSGNFTCTNSGTADATASTTCSVTGLPAGVTMGSCTINTASPAATWVAGNTVPVGKVVTCSVSGTPTTAGSVTVNGSTGATSDSNAPNNTASKSIVVSPSIGPLAVNDSAVTNYNTPVTISASSNDSAGTGATLTLNSIDLDPTTAGQQTSRTVAGEGTFVANSDGTVTFTPLSGFVGVVTVPYTIQNSLGTTSNVANITVTVRDSSGSGIPAAQNDYGTTAPTTPVTMSVLSNDQPSASKTLVNNSIVLSGANAAQGTWVANADGTVTFTPAAGFKGTATVNYTVRDTGGGTSNTATITVTVSGGSQPSAQNDSASTKPSTAVTMAVLSNDTPGTGNILTTGSIALSGTTPSNGSWVANAYGTVTFTPANGFTGTATANYTVQDSGGGTSNTATITVTVNPVAPAATNDTAPAGIRTLTPATNDTASAGATLNPSTVDLDPNTAGIQRTFTVTGQGTWDVIDNNGTVRFTPVAGFYGIARLTYSVSDSLGNTATAVMSVPIDPSGVVYDSSTRAVIAGATVTLLYNGGSANAYVTTGNATMSTNASGQYAFFLTGAAPAGTYSLTVSKGGYRFQSLVIPPAAGSWPAGGGSIGVVGAPSGAQSTLYYLSGPLPTTDVTNNNIPLDPLPGAVSVPTLSEWGMLILSGLMLLAGMAQLRRRAE